MLFYVSKKMWLPDVSLWYMDFYSWCCFRNMFRLCLWQTFVQVRREGCFGEGDLFISSLSVLSFPSMYVSYTLVHHFLRLPSSSSLSSSCTPLQPTRLPSKRRRGLASVWSAQGDSVCTQCLPSWANSSAAAVWAKPGVLVVTNVPLQEQVRPPATSDFYPFSKRTKDQNIKPSTTQHYLTLIWPCKSADIYTSLHLRGIEFCPVVQCPAGLC